MDTKIKEDLFRYYYFTNACSILNEFNLSKQEVMALVITYELSQVNKKVSLKDIREKMELSKPSMSILMSKLEKKGYLERHLNKENLREIYVQLSSYSMEIAKKTIKKINERIESIIEKMGINEVQKLIELNNEFKIISKEVMEEKTC